MTWSGRFGGLIMVSVLGPGLSGSGSSPAGSFRCVLG